MFALMSGIDNYNYEKAIVVGEPLHPDLRIETDSFEKAMVVGEPWNPHLRHWELFFVRKRWLWVNLETLISDIENL